MNNIKLNYNSILVLGLEADNILSENLAAIIDEATRIGYRLIDSATAYDNVDIFVNIIEDNAHNDIFLCIKINSSALINSSAKIRITNMLLKLGVNKLGLVFVHNTKIDDMPKCLNELIELQGEKKITSIGVSNFSIKHFQKYNELIPYVEVNQVEFPPYFHQDKLLDYCQTNEINIMAYRPLCHGKIIHDPTLQILTTKYKKSTAQITHRYLIQLGIITIPRTNSINHLDENVDIFELQHKDMEKIKGLNQDCKTCNGSWANF